MNKWSQIDLEPLRMESRKSESYLRRFRKVFSTEKIFKSRNLGWIQEISNADGLYNRFKLASKKR